MNLYYVELTTESLDAITFIVRAQTGVEAIGYAMQDYTGSGRHRYQGAVAGVSASPVGSDCVRISPILE